MALPVEGTLVLLGSPRQVLGGGVHPRRRRRRRHHPGVGAQVRGGVVVDQHRQCPVVAGSRRLQMGKLRADVGADAALADMARIEKQIDPMITRTPLCHIPSSPLGNGSHTTLLTGMSVSGTSMYSNGYFPLP